MHGSPGSSQDNVGYGCMQPRMVEAWREIWSTVRTPVSLFFILPLCIDSGIRKSDCFVGTGRRDHKPTCPIWTRHNRTIWV